jgi:hypothetical protein
MPAKLDREGPLVTEEFFVLFNDRYAFGGKFHWFCQAAAFERLEIFHQILPEAVMVRPTQLFRLPLNNADWVCRASQLAHSGGMWPARMNS